VVISTVSHFFHPERLRKVRKSPAVPPPRTGKPELAAFHVISHTPLRPLTSFNRVTSSRPSTLSPLVRRFHTAAASDGSRPEAAANTTLKTMTATTAPRPASGRISRGPRNAPGETGGVATDNSKYRTVSGWLQSACRRASPKLQTTGLCLDHSGASRRLALSGSF